MDIIESDIIVSVDILIWLFSIWKIIFVNKQASLGLWYSYSRASLE